MARFGGVVALAAGVAVLSGCESDLEEEDPAGYSACKYLDKSVAGYGDVEEGFGNQLLAGEAAADAETPEIRDAATAYTEGVDAYQVDTDALRSACEDNGFEFEN